MLLSKYSPFDAIAAFEKKLLDKYDDSYFNDGLSDFTPTVNTSEGEFAYHIDADLPGVNKEDINIDVHDGILTISGHRDKKEEIKEKDFYKVETSFGKFQRSFTLPSGIDSENISASTDNGVLAITIPKMEMSKDNKKIKVK